MQRVKTANCRNSDCLRLGFTGKFEDKASRWGLVISLSDECTPRGEIMSNLMTEDQVSKRLNVSVASLRRWRLLNRGPQFVKVGSLVRYQPEELDSWLASLPTGGTASTAVLRPDGLSKACK